MEDEQPGKTALAARLLLALGTIFTAPRAAKSADTMSFTIHIDAPLAPLLEDLPRQMRASLQEHLQCIAEAAEYLPPDDPLWHEVGERDGDGLRTYVAGCCVRLHLLPACRRVVVEQIGRVRICLPASLSLG